MKNKYIIALVVSVIILVASYNNYYQSRLLSTRERFCIVGCSSSSTTLNQTLNDISENLTTIVTNTMSNSAANCLTNQNIGINLKGSSFNGLCDLSVMQTANVNCNVSSIFNSSSTTDLTTLMNTAIDQSAKSSNKTVQDFMATGSSSTDSTVNVSMYLKQIVSKNIQTNKTQTCIAQAQVNQNQQIDMSGVVFNCTAGSTFNFGQNAQVAVLVSCLMNDLTSVATSDTNLQTLSQAADQAASTSQSGVGDIIRSFFNSTMMIVIACIIAAVIIGFFVLKVLLSPSGQLAITNASQAGIDAVKMEAAKSGGGGMGGMAKI